MIRTRVLDQNLDQVNGYYYQKLEVSCTFAWTFVYAFSKYGMGEKRLPNPMIININAGFTTDGRVSIPNLLRIFDF